MSTSSSATPPHVRALQNRSIRTIHMELDFLRETGVLSSTDVANIHSLLPTLPPHSRASTPVAPVSPPRSPSPITTASAAHQALLHRQTPLPSSATPAFPLNRATPMPSSATPANQKPSSGPPPPPGGPSSLGGASLGPMLVQALWEYPGPGNQAAQGDLTFDVGDTIEVVERTNADWWTGRKGGIQGLFPSSFVREVVRDIGQVAPPVQQQQQQQMGGQGGQGEGRGQQGGAGQGQQAGPSGWGGSGIGGVSGGGGIGGVAGVERPGPSSGSLGQARKPWGMRFAEMGV